MSTTTPLEPDSFAITANLAAPRLPRWAVILVAVISLGIAGLATLLLGWSPVPAWS